MTHFSPKWLVAVIGMTGSLILTQCQTTNQGAARGDKPFDPFAPAYVPDRIVFEVHLKPLLEIECVQCHNSVDANENARFNLETRKLALTTGTRAPAIKPGDPENSLLVQVLELDGTHPLNMPPAPDKIWGNRMEILKKWIAQGAIWPENVRLVRPQDWAE
ncbi:MAG: c-type cytochrome domain-containing protein [Verrucomicrobiota bacterium]